MPGITDHNKNIFSKSFFENNEMEILLEDNGCIVFISEVLCRHLGYTSAELTGQPLLCFIHPSHKTEIQKSYRLIRYIKKVTFNSYQICLRHKNNSKIFMEASGTISYKNNKTSGIICLEKINENRWKQAQRNENAKRLRLAEQAANFGIWEWNIKTGDIYISDHVTEILHIEKQSFNGRFDQFLSLFDKEGIRELKTELDKCYKSDKKLNQTLHINSQSSKTGWIKLVADLERDAHGKPDKMFGIIENIDEIVRYESKLLKKNKELSDINDEKNRFFSIIAHDIRTPFTAILGFSELLYDDYYELNDETRRNYIKTIKRSGEQTYQFIENLLIWTRSQMNKIVYNPVKIRVCDLISLMEEIFRPVYEKKDIKFISRCKEDIFIQADEDMLKTSLRNLISNAIKYTFSGGKVEVYSVLNGNKAEIVVKDNGVGMTEKKTSTLFSLNKGFSTPGTENESGTGLGMIICKEFVSKNKGTINVVSKKGKGTTFTISFPVFT
ncbi:ATP-binding protein [Saccharicrinis sp. FJH54]|uniref:sensor histidine kinase n=1 Tax=Saccharicrinis sp. FJH54 TaxID=3344665 RepID=UPI0035D40D93